MKVIAINGSPHPNGNTAFALKQAGLSLREEGIDFEILHIGNRAIHGCMACNKCFEKMNGKCIFAHDAVNEALPLLKDADGVIIGSPVYYSGIAGTMKSFLDRVFYVSAANGNYFRNKVGAAVVSVRRSGGSMTYNNLNMYLTISEMCIASSNYWNIIHGHQSGEAANDAEGIQVMRLLGRNMAWMLKMKEQSAGKTDEPALIDKIFTNFIR